MSRKTKGYTLIELMVVIILLGLVFAITAPRFRDAVLNDNLKSTTRKLIGKINELRTDAIQKQESLVLFFDLESNMYWHGPGGLTPEGRDLYRKERATYLPQGIRITDISFKDRDKKIGGEISLQFNKRGYVQQSAIHLESEDGREFTIVLRPFLPGVKYSKDILSLKTYDKKSGSHHKKTPHRNIPGGLRSGAVETGCLCEIQHGSQEDSPEQEVPGLYTP